MKPSVFNALRFFGKVCKQQNYSRFSVFFPFIHERLTVIIILAGKTPYFSAGMKVCVKPGTI